MSYTGTACAVTYLREITTMLRSTLLLITIITMLGLSILAGVLFSRPAKPPQPVPVVVPQPVKPVKHELVVKADCDESPLFYMAGTHYDCRMR
jgi:hypothetical protein